MTELYHTYENLLDNFQLIANTPRKNGSGKSHIPRPFRFSRNTAAEFDTNGYPDLIPELITQWINANLKREHTQRKPNNQYET